MSKSFQVSVCFLSLLLAACGNSSGPASLDPNGHWVGSAPNTVGGTITVDVTLAESAGALTGNGAIVTTSTTPGAGQNLPVLVAGTFASPTIALQMRSPPGANPSIVGAVTYAGALSGSTISGLYQGSIAMTLSRR